MRYPRLFLLTLLFVAAPLAVTAAAPAPASAAAEAGAATGDAPAKAAEADSPTGGKADLSRYKEEPVSGGRLLVTAYMVMWLLVAAFVGRVLWRQARVEADLQQLDERVSLAEEQART